MVPPRIPMIFIICYILPQIQQIYYIINANPRLSLRKSNPLLNRSVSMVKNKFISVLIWKKITFFIIMNN